MARLTVALAAAAVLAFAVGLVAYGHLLPGPGEEGVLARHLIVYVAATIAATVLYTAACVVAHRKPPGLVAVLAVGFAARVILLFGAPAPILEGDPARLRFDGRMVNQRLNPYEFKPAHLMDEDPQDVLLTGAQLERLMRARAAMSASADAPRPEEVARPDLRSSSTPLALWLATIGDSFKPQSTRGYAFLVLVADVLATFLLLLALRSQGLPLSWIIVYSWCPVLLKEVYVTLSVEAFVLPALAGLVYCIVSSRRLISAVPVAICTALRPAMILLLPVFGRRFGFLGFALAAALLVLPYVPFHTPDVPASSYLEGQVHGWRHYEYNSCLENGLRGSLRYLPYRADSTLTIAGVKIVEPEEKLDVLLAKLIGVVVLLGVVAYLVIRIRPGEGAPDAERRASLTDLFSILVAMLLVSPVLHPWHALWLLPLLVVRPFGIAWLLLPGLVSISYLTHLAGPHAADITLLGGRVSFRAIEFGVLGLFVLLDVLWFSSLFPLFEAQRTRVAERLAHEDEAVAAASLEPEFEFANDAY